MLRDRADERLQQAGDRLASIVVPTARFEATRALTSSPPSACGCRAKGGQAGDSYH
jgi:hypothetical protein